MGRGEAPGLSEKRIGGAAWDQPFLLAPPDFDEEPEDLEDDELDRPEEPPDLTEPEERDGEDPPDRGALTERPEDWLEDLGAA